MSLGPDPVGRGLTAESTIVTTPEGRKRTWSVALALILGACAPSTERKWEKASATPATAQRDEAECLTVAGLERVPRAHAGTAAIPGRDADFSGRGYAAYVACMEAKGYTRPDR